MTAVDAPVGRPAVGRAGGTDWWEWVTGRGRWEWAPARSQTRHRCCQVPAPRAHLASEQLQFVTLYPWPVQTDPPGSRWGRRVSFHNLKGFYGVLLFAPHLRQGKLTLETP